MKNNKELLKQFMEDLKYQDRLEFYDKNLNVHIKKQEEEDRKLERYEHEEHIIDLINLYQGIYSLEEDEDTLIGLVKEIGVSKEGILSGLEKGYKTHLDNFKKLGGDISEYPKDLGDLVK